MSRGRGRGRGGRGAVRAGEFVPDSAGSGIDTQKDGNSNSNSSGNNNGLEDWMETGEEEDEKNKSDTLALMNGQSGGI